MGSGKKSKNLDLIVLNSLKDKGAGFGHSTNKVSILDNKGNKTEFPLKEKTEVAKDIVSSIVKVMEQKEVKYLTATIGVQEEVARDAEEAQAVADKDARELVKAAKQERLDSVRSKLGAMGLTTEEVKDAFGL